MRMIIRIRLRFKGLRFSIVDCYCYDMKNSSFLQDKNHSRRVKYDGQEYSSQTGVHI